MGHNRGIDAGWWLAACVATFLVCIAGISYFHVTGQAKWDEKDKQNSLIYGARFILRLPVFLTHLIAFYIFLNPTFLPVLFPEIRFLLRLLFLFGGFRFCDWLDLFLASRWRFWQRLHGLDAQGN